MASSLASQLQTIRLEQGGSAPGTQTGKPSLLFSPQEAADVDLQTIYNIAQNGLEELISLDGRFQPFRQTLFSHESMRVEREQETEAVNSKLNVSIATFLQLLSGFILLRPAHQVLEYLIRHYRVQAYNVEAFMSCILPYHETNLFVRMVQLLHLGKTRWQFLEGVQKNGTALPRELLVQRCIHDMALLHAVCDVGRAWADNKVGVSFSAVVLLEMLAKAPVVSDDLVKQILPYIQEGFHKDAPQDFRAGALMLITQMSNRAALSESLIDNLFENLGKGPASLRSGAAVTQGAPTAFLVENLMVMVHLTQTQDMKVFPEKALKWLVHYRDMADVIADIAKRFNATKFISMLLPVLTELSLRHANYEQKLEDVLKKVPLAGHVGAVVSCLLTLSFAGLDDAAMTKAREVTIPALRLLATRYSAELDEALNRALKDKSGETKSEVFDLLQKAMEGSIHAPLAESHSTLFLSINHPQAHIREMAVKRTVEMAAANKDDSQLRLLAEDAVLQRLEDENPSVVNRVLSLPIANLLPAPTLYLAISSVLKRIHPDLTAGSKEQQNAARGTVKLALRLLTSSDFLEREPSHVELVAKLLLSYLLSTTQTRRLSKIAVGLASQVPSSIFSHLDDSPAAVSEAETEDEDAKDGKKTRQLSDVAANNRLVSGLSTAVLDNPEQLLQVYSSARGQSEGARALVLLVLKECITVATPDVLPAIASSVLPILREEWLQANVDGKFWETHAKSVDYTAWGSDFTPPAPSGGWYSSFTTVLRGDTLLHVYYRLVASMVAAQGTLSEKTPLPRWWMDSFTLFAEAPKPLFEPHLRCLLSAAPSPEAALRILGHFFTGPASTFPASSQTCSLELLLSRHLSKDGDAKPNATTWQFAELALPYLLVAATNSRKPVRHAALECIASIAVNHPATPAQRGASKAAKQGRLSPDDFSKLIRAIAESREVLVADGANLASVFGRVLGPGPGNAEPMLPEALPYLIEGALGLGDAHGVRMLLSALKGAGRTGVQARCTHALATQLLERRRRHHLSAVGATGMAITEEGSPLTEEEVQLLVVLLQMYNAETATLLKEEETAGASAPGPKLSTLLSALTCELGTGQVSSPAVLAPCLAAVGCLTPDFYSSLGRGCQDKVLAGLLLLIGRHGAEASVRSSAHKALAALNVEGATFRRLLLGVIEAPADNHQNGVGEDEGGSAKKKKQSKTKAVETEVPSGAVAQWAPSNNLVRATTTLLEVLQWKTSVPGRDVLVAPLFRLLRLILDERWPGGADASGRTRGEDLAGDVATLAVSTGVAYVQQLGLMVLGDIGSQLGKKLAEDWTSDLASWDVDLVVNLIQRTSDSATRNLALELVAVVAKTMPERVLKHILSLVGGLTLTMDDGHSQRVAHQMLTAVVPAWLAHSQDLRSLIQVFVDALFSLPAGRRLPLATSLLKSIPDTSAEALSTLLLLLFRQCAETSPQEDWVPDLAANLCLRAPPPARLHSLVKLLQSAYGKDAELEGRPLRRLQRFATDLTTQQILSVSFARALEEGEGSAADGGALQEGFVALMEQVLVRIQSAGKKDGQKAAVESAYKLLDALNDVMAPSSYLQGMTSLVQRPDTHIRRKVLRLFTRKVKEPSKAVLSRRQRKQLAQEQSADADMDGPGDGQLYADMALEIAKLLTGPEAESSGTTREAALDAVSALASAYGAQAPTAFQLCIPPAVNSLSDDRPQTVAAAVSCLAALISAVGSHALPHVPSAVPKLLRVAHDAATDVDADVDTDEEAQAAGLEVVVASLNALKAIVLELGAFLSPYVGDLLGLVVLKRSVLTHATPAVPETAAAIRAVLPEKIPARLLLDPLFGAYAGAVTNGDEAARALFELLASVASRLDRASVTTYHSKLFDFFLVAFDLRRTSPASLTSIPSVESSVISAFLALVMKLSENNFKPLFLKTLDWVQSEIIDGEPVLGGGHVARHTLFFSLVIQLAERLRSVFVPYFRYLLDVCIAHLTGGQVPEDNDGTKVKAKKRKSSKAVAVTGVDSSQWHLRWLVVCTLHKCFLFDTVGFLDAAIFQRLLGPIVAQISTAPPSEAPLTAEQSAESRLIASVAEMDDAIVACLGQMALTAASDVLWKPLNHEVLMCTRSENIRTRMVGLRVVELLVERLKEEYLVLLPESIPFLGELLEDREMPIVAKCQTVVKSLEQLSGEDLAQYF